ncbi:Hypothetical predicted protein [Xyrichtys novacula]|uniref:Uncharacterized protein n=1 Tax=Xyrichtys novacula TaxID=13765 RepID=A0AAV1F594_XYRNO|nr:Hypothetical predicted protein [Xyrichtys novacula]
MPWPPWIYLQISEEKPVCLKKPGAVGLMCLSHAPPVCENSVPLRLSRCRSDNQKHLLCRRLQGDDENNNNNNNNKNPALPADIGALMKQAHTSLPPTTHPCIHVTLPRWYCVSMPGHVNAHVILTHTTWKLFTVPYYINKVV